MDGREEDKDTETKMEMESVALKVVETGDMEVAVQVENTPEILFKKI